ncbi:pyridoxal-phosphate dependent enzyme [Lysobacter sp. S4-A87]|uniref:pyridoxal-phosphate dependent enzyme n=1 Tax=Lysobacter sp. S4-A87 TaxID=2925843 RepID=UPI001F538990|nr:pyridoxal-phosphate dependent enzyme [Lysobacter sp. S4-A87]UNK48290.1 pyridoxal-phosphate dependent enzyme [Lysobacter sp. S4-A87]
MESTTHGTAADFATLFPQYRPTDLVELPRLAATARVGRVFAKLESQRPFGNFKVLGGMLAGLRALVRASGAASLQDLLAGGTRQPGLPRLICASDGNHGLSVALAAQRAGAEARIYLPASVGPVRVQRIADRGAQIVIVDGSYDDAVDAAAAAAAAGDGLLIADTDPDPANHVVADVMAGYRLITDELGVQLRELGVRPGHAFVQAGVGGLAAALADGLRPHMGGAARLVVVEPAAAACVARALEMHKPTLIEGDLHTVAEMLACGLASAAALPALRRAGATAVAVDESGLAEAVYLLRQSGGPESTPSGAAGLAGLLRVAGDPALFEAHGLAGDSDVLLVVTERAPEIDGNGG